MEQVDAALSTLPGGSAIRRACAARPSTTTVWVRHRWPAGLHLHTASTYPPGAASAGGDGLFGGLHSAVRHVNGRSAQDPVPSTASAPVMAI